MLSPDAFPVAPGLVIDRRRPYEGYARIRARSPVYTTPTGLVLVTGHAAAAAVMKDPRLKRFTVAGGAREQMSSDPLVRRTAELSAATVLFSNPPDHARRRAFLSRAFQPRIVEDMRGAIAEVIAPMLDRAAAQGGLDVVAELASPFPVQVIAQLIGVPRADWPDCVRWSSALAPTIDASISHDTMARARHAASEFSDYMGRLFDSRRRRPKGDLLTTLVQAAGDELTPTELVSNVMTLFIAGHETTTGILSSTFVILHEHPEARAQLRARPELLPTAIEEFLRYEAPIQLSARLADETIVVEGTTIPKGATIWVLIGGANRDPARFPEPDRLDITRDPNPHLAFGTGPHFCLGAPLARLEIEVALAAFLKRFPDWRLVDPAPRLREALTLRGYERLLLEL